MKIKYSTTFSEKNKNTAYLITKQYRTVTSCDTLLLREPFKSIIKQQFNYLLLSQSGYS